MIALALSNASIWRLDLLCDTFPADSGGIAAFCLLFQLDTGDPIATDYLAPRFDLDERANVSNGKYIGIVGGKWI